MQKKIKVSNHDNEIIEAYKIAAIIVARFGEKYLPIFQRLQKEVNSIEEKKMIISLAERVASEVC